MFCEGDGAFNKSDETFWNEWSGQNDSLAAGERGCIRGVGSGLFRAYLGAFFLGAWSWKDGILNPLFMKGGVTLGLGLAYGKRLSLIQ